MTTFTVKIKGTSTSWEFTQTSPDLGLIEIHQSVSPIIPFAVVEIANNDHGLENVDPGDAVFIDINGARLFDGYVDKITIDWRGVQVYRFACIGKAVDLYKVWTDKDDEYSGYTNEIAQTLISSYLPDFSFEFAPSSAASNSGIQVQSFKTKGRTVGKCLEDLASMDAFYFIVSGNESNPELGTVYWIQSSGNIGTLTDNDVKQRRIKRAGSKNKINKVFIRGGYGVVSVTDTIWGPETTSPSVNQPAVIFQPSTSGIRRITLALKNTSTAYDRQLTVALYPVEFNVAPWMEVYAPEGWLSPTNVRDENLSFGYFATTLVEFGPDSGSAIALNLKNEDGYFFHYVSDAYIAISADYPIDLYYQFNDGTLRHILVKTRTLDDYTIVRIPVNTSVSSLAFLPLPQDLSHVHIWEVLVFSPSPLPDTTWQDHIIRIAKERVGHEYEKTVTVPSSTTRIKCQAEFNVKLSSAPYWALMLSSPYSSVEIWEHSTPQYSLGKLNYLHANLNNLNDPFIGFLDSGAKEFDAEIEWLDDIYYEYNKAPSLQYTFPFEYYNENITHINEARRIASALIIRNQSDFIADLEVNGSEQYVPLKFITLNLQSIGINADYEILGTTHLLIPRKYYRTKLKLGKDVLSLDHIVSKIKSDLKSKQLV